MKKTIFGKINNTRGMTNNQVMCHGKYSLTKKNTWGINSHLNKFKKGDRVKITIETVSKNEYTKQCYGSEKNE